MKKQEVLEKYFKSLKIENYSDQTIKSYYSALKIFLDWVTQEKLEKVNEEDIQNYLFWCKTEKKYSFSAMKHVIAAIRYFYLKVLEQPVPKSLNIKLRKPKNLPTVLSQREIGKILKVTSNLKHRTILLLIYSAGLRLGELLNLEVGDIDSQAKRVHIRQSKGKKDRYVMLSGNVIELLRKYFIEFRPETFLFEGRKGGKYSPKSVQSVFKKALKNAGIRKKATVHTLRHSFATHLLDDGTDIRYIQELLGHKRLETTKIYTHVSSYSINQIKSPAEKLKF